MEFSNELWAYIMVFLLAAIPWIEVAVIPLGIVKGLSPFWVGLLAFAGNFSTVFILVIFFERIMAMRKKKSKEGKSRRQRRAKEIFNKYGLPGLSIAAPIQ
ncbi:small multi-drug export protein [Peribacillus acanthi]|uniref:small multi-drug export protein n=1 Tax=Peribacillus acanthi TaxID=2171554 RepID=UPI001F0BA09E|nr:small multi-drug export protein [Peribacillus acanthi]